MYSKSSKLTDYEPAVKVFVTKGFYYDEVVSLNGLLSSNVQAVELKALELRALSSVCKL